MRLKKRKKSTLFTDISKPFHQELFSKCLIMKRFLYLTLEKLNRKKIEIENKIIEFIENILNEGLVYKARLHKLPLKLKKEAKVTKNQTIKLITRQTKKTKLAILKELKRTKKKGERVLKLKLKTLRNNVKFVRGRLSADFPFLKQPRQIQNSLKQSKFATGQVKFNNQEEQRKIEVPIFFSILGWRPYLTIKKIGEGIFWPFRKWWQEAVAVILLVAMVASSFFWYQAVPVLGATYTWVQIDWSGGLDAGVYPVHPTNQTGWTKYNAKDTGIATGTELTFTATAGSKTQTTDTDFNAGTFATTTVSGTDGVASVVLDKNATAGSWANQTIDSTDSVGSHPSIALDSYDYPHISYYDSTNGNLKYARWTGTNWNITTVDITGNVGDYTSIAIDSSNAPHIAYQDVTNQDLKYATYVGSGGNCSGSSAWNCSTIDSSGSAGNYNSIALDSYGYPHISSLTLAVDDGLLRYAKWNGTTWSVETVHNAGYGQYATYMTSLILDSSNYPHIAHYMQGYRSGFKNAVLYTKWSGATWSTTLVKSDTLGYVHGDTSLAIDASLNYYITHYDRTGSVWKIELLGTGAGSIDNTVGDARGRQTSLIRDGSGNLHVSYSTSGNVLRYGKKITTWSTENVNSDGIYSSLKVDSASFPHIAYYIVGTADLGYATRPYNVSGDFTSSAIDTGQSSDFTTLAFTIIKPTNTDLKFQLRTAATQADLSTATWYGPTGTTDYYTTTGTTINSVHDGQRWVQYKAFFSTTDTTVTPTLSDITINYQYYPASATLTSSPYNASDAANVLAKIEWTENLPANTDIKFQLRTAPDSAGAPGTWSSWCGPDNGAVGCATTTYFTDPTGGETVDADFTDGANDQWIQYKVWLETTNSSLTPTLSDVTLTYVINGPPVVSNVTASQDAAGIVNVTYDLSDPESETPTTSLLYDIGVTLNEELTSSDTTAITVSNATNLPSSGTIQIESEQISYTSKSGNDLVGTITRGANNTKAVAHSLGQAIWINAVTTTGVGANTPLGTGKTATWTAKTDLDGFYSASVKIRINANDGNLANQVGYGDSSAFTLDTKDPTSPSISIDSGAATTQSFSVTLTLSATDDTMSAGVSGYMKLSNNADLSADGINPDSGNWITYNTSKSWTLTSGDGTKTVYVQYKDEKGNTSTTVSDDIYKSSPPSVTNVTASQDSNGFVNVSYNVTDAVQSTLTITLKYWNGSIWVNTITVSGNVGANVAVGTGKAIIWTAKSDYSSQYTTLMKMQVLADDGNTQENTGSADSVNFTLDTKDPVAGTPTGGGTGININQNALTSKSNDKTNSTSVTLYLSATDDSAFQMILSNDGVFDNETYEAYATTKAWNLTSGNGTKTVYVKFKDPYGNETSAYSDTITLDTAAPATPSSMFIQDISNAQTSEYRMFVNWAKNTEADWVNYKFYRSTNGTDYTLQQTITDININYVMDTGLTQGTTYYYKLTSGDDINNTSNYSQVVSLVAGSQPSDNVEPVISSVVAGTPTTSSVKITWTTNEVSDSTVLYSTDTSYNLTQGVTGYETSHSVTLIGLQAGTTYNYKVRSIDPSSNTATSSAGQFTTASADVTSPVISDIQTSNITHNSVKIIWNTVAEASTSMVEYSTIEFATGVVGGVYGFYDLIFSHAVTLPPTLSASTTYYFKVRSQDAAGNERVSTQQSFITLTAPSADITPPLISNILSSNIQYNTATITWTTNENSSSFVEFGTTTSYGRISGQYDSVTSHSVTLPKDLSPATQYHFRVRSVDASGNEAISTDNTFTTAADPADSTAPVISSVAVGEPTATSVTITWTTNEDSNSYIGYSEDKTYSSEQGNPEMVTSHSVTLVGLTPSTQYYFRVKSTDPSGNIATDDNSGQGYTFSTASGTTPPVISAIQIVNVTHNSAEIAWTTDKSSNSFVEYGLDTSYGKTSGQYDSVTSHPVTLTNLLSQATYHFRVRSSGSSEAVSQDYTFTTEPAPDITPPVISAVQSTNITLTSATISWTTNENSDSLVDYGTTTSYGLVAGTTAESVTSHSVNLTGLSSGTVYYFQVRSKDSSGNLTTDNNSGASYQFTAVADTTPPTISNVASPVVDRNSATITWETNESATSQVEYSLNSDLTGSTLTTIITDLRQDHSVIISNLTSSTKYYYRVKSKDAADNEAISPATSPFKEFTTAATKEDVTAPTISSVATSSLTLTSVTISWTTNENSNSLVDYGTTISLGALTGNVSDSVTSHSVTLSNLSLNTKYYFQVRSQDSAGNTATDNNSGNYYTFTTLADTTPPTISNVTTAVIRDTSAVVTWQTDELSTSRVEYGTSISYGSQTIEDTTLTIQHSVTLTGLTKETKYYYKVIPKDASNNSAQDDNSGQGFTFTTTKAPGETIYVGGGGGGGVTLDVWPPKVSKVEISNITQNSATISWETDEQGNSLVSYGLTTDYGSLAGNHQEKLRIHKVILTNLNSGTTYHFQAVSYDSAGNAGKSSDITFTTLTKEVIPPEEIVEVPKEVKEMEEKIEEEVGVVELIKKSSQTFISKILEALPYNPFLIGIDEEKFISSISEIAPKIVSSPTIAGEYPMVEVGADYARIIWVTDKKSNSIVALATAEEYDPTRDEPYVMIEGNVDELVTYHEVYVNGLKPATLYHYEVRSRAQLGDWAKSRDRTFTTLSRLPKLSEIELLEIKENIATLSWSTTLSTKTRIEIIDVKTGEKIIQEDPSFLREHKLIIKNLKVATSYSLQIFAEDETGNTSFSPVLPFSTSISLEPPVIFQVRVSTALIPGRVERVQAIISWKTDKPATSRVYYEEGITIKEELTFSTPLDPNLVIDHIVITTAFKTGRVYRFRVESIDAFNNASYSRDFTILTPRSRESVLDLIIQNFEQTFEFLKGIRF